jgi:putrescine aminotransferase
VLEITTRPQVRANVDAMAARFADGLAGLMASHDGWFTGVRQDGLVMGLELAHPEGAMHLTRALYERGVWAIFSSLDPSVLQFKPGLLVDAPLVDNVLARLDESLASARDAASSGTGLPSIHPHAEAAA